MTIWREWRSLSGVPHLVDLAAGGRCATCGRAHECPTCLAGPGELCATPYGPGHRLHGRPHGNRAGVLSNGLHPGHGSNPRGAVCQVCAARGAGFRWAATCEARGHLS